MKIVSFLSDLLDRFSVVLGAFIGSQIPQFMHQYTQRMAGHVEALEKLLNQLQELAKHSHQNLQQYIQKFLDSSDSDFNLQGQFLEGVVSRHQELNQVLQEITQSSFWLRPYYFIKGFQSDIAQSTFQSFFPGFSFTLEGLCYAGAGMLLGWCLYRTIAKVTVSLLRWPVSFFKKS